MSLNTTLKIIRTGNWKHFTTPKEITFVPTAPKNKDVLTLDEIARIFDNLQLLGFTKINIIDEFFLKDKEHAFKILGLIEERMMLFSVATNWDTILEEEISELSLYWGLISVGVFIDGPGSYKKLTLFIKSIYQFNIPITFEYRYKLNNNNQIDYTGSFFIFPNLKIDNGAYANGLIDEKMFNEKVIKIRNELKPIN